MLQVYKRRLLIGLMILLGLFALIFILAILNLNKGEPLFGIGISYDTENIIIMFLSILSMAKVIHEIIKVEH